MDRRRFLSSTVKASGGFVLSSRATGQAADPRQDDLSVGLIGAGTQGQVLLNTCMKIPKVRIRAVCDIWEAYNLKRASDMLKAYKQEHTAYVDYRDMLDKEKDLDAVIIATPDFWHAEQTIASLRAGLNVYCESVMSNTLEGARAMLRAAKETGRLLQIGCQRRSNPRYRHGNAHVIHETKLLGKITAINGQWNRSVQPNRGWPKRAPLDESTLTKYGFQSMQQFRNWRWYKELGGGPIAELASHQVDVFNWFMDARPTSVLASAGTDYYDKETHECYDTVMAVYEYETQKGSVRAFYQTINSNSSFGYFEKFMGDEGTLCISEAGGRAKVYREPSAPDWDKWVKIGYLEAPVKKEKQPADAVLDVQETVEPPSYALPVKFNDPVHKPHLENFLNAVRGQEELNYPAETAYESTVTVLKINEAVKSGQKMSFRPADFQV